MISGLAGSSTVEENKQANAGKSRHQHKPHCGIDTRQNGYHSSYASRPIPCPLIHSWKSQNNEQSV